GSEQEAVEVCPLDPSLAPVDGDGGRDRAQRLLDGGVPRLDLVEPAAAGAQEELHLTPRPVPGQELLELRDPVDDDDSGRGAHDDAPAPSLVRSGVSRSGVITKESTSGSLPDSSRRASLHSTWSGRSR